MDCTSGRARGFGLVEELVALAILALAVAAALGVLGDTRAAFRKAEGMAEAQQATRSALDRMVADLRLAGFNVHPDGDPSRPDEAIEGAYDTAIVVRADFDASDPALAATPETDLSGGAFATVSTGNDEIVAYVLGKPDGSAPDTLTFESDVAESPRDGRVEIVRIPNVALIHDAPPYTLYRVELDPDVHRLGRSGSMTRTPLMEDVTSLSFRYRDPTGMAVNPAFDLGSLADDVGGADGADGRDRRARIRGIEVELTGMIRPRDPFWADRDPALRAHRKFRLGSLVTPQNLGRSGERDRP